MLALLVVPVIEVFIILQVGHAIGGWPTFFLLVAWSALGAWIVKREAHQALGALREAFATGRMPAHELSDAALVLVGGALLLAPGFLTDAVGLFFLLPFTRPLTRGLLTRAVTTRLFGRGTVGLGRVWNTGAPQAPRPRPSRRRAPVDEVIEGEILD